MRLLLSILIVCLGGIVFSQNNLTGIYQGFIKKAGSKTADILYISFDEGAYFTRIELKDEDIYAVKRFKVNASKSGVEIEETTSKSSSNTRNTPRCKLKFELSNNEETGYLSGSYKSIDCRNDIGEVVLYPSNLTFSNSEEPMATKTWFNQFLRDYDNGYPAPHIRKKQMEGFEFKPIYFDHDKSEIREEYKEYLKKMVRIVNGHHDIRISVTGHTDAVGTDEYNIRLSERRVKSIMAYFVSLGLAPDKLEIDFKGEKNPVDTNNTAEGKQRNRRVDFDFI